MKNVMILVLLLSTVACAYNPVVDSRGLKGKDVAFRYNDDLETCKAIAKENTNDFVETYKAIYNYYIRPATMWIPDKMEFKYKSLVKKCLTNRGHSVLD